MCPGRDRTTPFVISPTSQRDVRVEKKKKKTRGGEKEKARKRGVEPITKERKKEKSVNTDVIIIADFMQPMKDAHHSDGNGGAEGAGGQGRVESRRNVA